MVSFFGQGGIGGQLRLELSLSRACLTMEDVESMMRDCGAFIDMLAERVSDVLKNTAA